MTTIEEILDTTAQVTPAPAAPPWQRAAERAADEARAESLAHGGDPIEALARARNAFELAARGVEPRALVVNPVPLARWRIASDGRIVARTMSRVRPGDRVALFGSADQRDERLIVSVSPGPAGSFDCETSPPPGPAERAVALAEREAHERAIAARAAIGGDTRSRGLEAALRADADKADAAGATNDFDAARDDGRRAGEVCSEARARYERDREAAARAGLLLPSPVFEAGSILTPYGIRRATAAEVEHEKRPMLADAVAGLTEAIKEERREEYVVTVGHLRMTPDGKLEGANLPPSRVESRAWSRLASAAGLGDGAAFLGRASMGVRALAWNQHAEGDNRAKLRVRGQGDGRSIWAAVGERYPAADADRSARVVARALESLGRDSLRARVDYDGQSWRIEASQHSPIRAEKMGAGEVLRAGVIVSGNDAGQGAIQVRAAILQNLCLNLQVLGETFGGAVSIAHRGSVGRLLADLREGIIRAEQAIGVFMDRWTEASRERVSDPHGTIRAVIARGLVTIPGGRKAREAMASQIGDAHDQGLADGTMASANGPSSATIVDGFTRWAHARAGISLDTFALDAIREEATGLLAKPLPEPISLAQMLAAP